MSKVIRLHPETAARLEKHKRLGERLSETLERVLKEVWP